MLGVRFITGAGYVKVIGFEAVTEKGFEVFVTGTGFEVGTSSGAGTGVGLDTGSGMGISLNSDMDSSIVMASSLKLRTREYSISGKCCGMQASLSAFEGHSGALAFLSAT